MAPPMLILRGHSPRRWRWWKEIHTFFKMDFDSKEVWSLPPPIQPYSGCIETNKVFWGDAQVAHIFCINTGRNNSHDRGKEAMTMPIYKRRSVNLDDKTYRIG